MQKLYNGLYVSSILFQTEAISNKDVNLDISNNSSIRIRVATGGVSSTYHADNTLTLKNLTIS